MTDRLIKEIKPVIRYAGTLESDPRKYNQKKRKMQEKTHVFDPIMRDFGR